MNIITINRFRNGFMLFEVIFSIALVTVLVYPTLELILQFQSLFLHRKTMPEISRRVYFEPKQGTKNCDEFLSSLQNAYTRYRETKGELPEDLLHEHEFNLNDLVETVPYSSQLLGFGTTSAITNIKMHDGQLYISLNSASSSDPDIVSTKIFDFVSNPSSATYQKLHTGPGISEISLSNSALYAADTSVTDAIQKFDYNNGTIKLLDKFSIPKLSPSFGAIAKSVETFGPYTLVGLEKNIGPEIYLFDSLTGAIRAQLETGYGITRMRMRGKILFVLGPLDPEIEVFEISTRTSADQVTISKVGSFDATGFSGNGRSLDFFDNILILGRSRGNDEFTVLRLSGTSTQDIQVLFNLDLIQSLKVSASIDSLVAASSSVFVTTSDQAKEFQLLVYNMVDNNNTAHRVGYLDLPSRTNDFICFNNTVFVGSVDPAYALVKIKIKNTY